MYRAVGMVVRPLVVRGSWKSIRYESIGASAHDPGQDTKATGNQTHSQTNEPPVTKVTQPQPTKKTIAQLDEELRLKMGGVSGDGGDAGVEYEDGRPADMKRSVRNNMFRYI